MVMEELVRNVNKEFKAMETEAIAGREHPLIIRMLRQLILLTTINHGSTDDVETGDPHPVNTPTLTVEPAIENEEPVKTFDPPMPGGNFSAQMERQAAREKAAAVWDDSPPKL